MSEAVVAIRKSVPLGSQLWKRITCCDVTRKEDLASVYAEIRSRMPPIGGVAQGAMVLHDVGVRNMTLDTFGKVMRPKVEGTIHLHDLFREEKLDFFIVFSSATCIDANPG
ncbi:KR domain-containing protein [Xylariaceae sp. FL1272]|nr:KR domain-containing protein [Xylariaceae sp. FL1272]